MLDWTNLPEPFKRNVVKELDFFDRCHLRKCSKTEKNLVDSCPISLEYIRIRKDNQTNGKIDFVVSQDQKVLRWNTEDSENVIRDFLRIVGHPKTKLDEIIIGFPYGNSFNSEFFQILERELKSMKLNFKIHTDHFFWSGGREYDSFILELFKKLDPKALRKLHLDTCPSKEIMEKVLKTEQWKSLKKLHVAGYQTFMGPLTFPVEELVHFQNLKVKQKNMTTGDVLAVFQSFRTMPRPIGSFFTLGTNVAFDNYGILEILGPSLFFMEDQLCRVYPIDGSNLVLLVEIGTWFIYGNVRTKEQILDDEKKRYSDWLEHIQRLGEGVPY